MPALTRLRHPGTWLRPDRSLSRRDPLTGLPDRAAFEAALARRARDPAPFAVAMIDLARFKLVNDTHGHAAGDALLVALADRFRALMDRGALVARIGGDEFAALLPDGPGPDPAPALDDALSRLRCAVDAPFSFNGFTATCGAGIGVARSNGRHDPATLLARADTAMYRAKRDDPAGTRFSCPELDEAVELRRSLALRLQSAIAADQLVLEFRPTLSLPGGGTIGREALPCWHHPVLGQLPFETVATLAEDGGGSQQLLVWTLHTACNAARAAREPVPVSVNLSPLMLADPGLPDLVAEVLRDTALPPAMLGFELDEAALGRDRDRSLHGLDALRRLGVTLVLDGFGSGPCSLALLRLIRFDRVKLSRQVFDADPAGAATLDGLPPLLSLLVPVIRRLGIPVTAEGVDTPARLRFALRAGCDAMQGTLPRPWPVLAAA